MWKEVLEPRGCTAGYCHGAQAGGMLLQSETQAIEQMVNVAATQEDCGVTVRVVPGSPEDSVLWARVQPGDDTCSANRMPQGGEPLTEIEAALVYDWILSGAKP